jgi:ornithine cyclodeaminase/alanine dehydrogenase-like protein (mu-crystallin family)
MSMQFEILYLSQSDVIKAGLTMSETVDIVERAYRAHGRGEAVIPAKIVMDLETVGRPRAGANAMPSYIMDGWNVIGIKWWTFNYDNPTKHNVPSHFPLLILNDPETVAPYAIMEANWMTAMRTGAASAVGVKYLAKKNPKSLFIIGLGYQSRFQLRAVNEVMKIEEVYVNDISKKAEEQFAKEMAEELGLKITPEPVRDAVQKSDVIITATAANEPLIKFDWVRKGTLISAVGSFQEFDFVTIKSVNKIVVDHLKQTSYIGNLRKWYAKGYFTDREVYGEIGEIVSGKKPGRTSEDEIILYIPIGVSILDLACGSLIFRRAKEKGLGQTLKYF